MDERIRFVIPLKDGEGMAALYVLLPMCRAGHHSDPVLAAACSMDPLQHSGAIVWRKIVVAGMR